MSGLGPLALLLGVLLAPQDPVDALQEALRLADEGRLADAWQALLSESDPVRRARGRATLFLRAGDFGGELDAAEEGLTHVPEDQELLYFAAQAALWLRDDERADAYLDRLERALARNAPPDPAGWQALVGRFRANVAELEAARLDRERTIARSRTVSLVLLAGTLVGLGVLSLRAGPRAPYGTPAP